MWYDCPAESISVEKKVEEECRMFTDVSHLISQKCQ